MSGLEMAADEVGGSAIVPFAADTAGNIAEEGEVGGSSPVPIVEDTEQEIQPEDEEQALALNADGLRFWLNEVLLDNMKLEKQLQLSKKARTMAAEMCRTGKPQAGLLPPVQQPAFMKLPKGRNNNRNKKRKASEADQPPQAEAPSKRQGVEPELVTVPGDGTPAAWVAALEASMQPANAQGDENPADLSQPTTSAAKPIVAANPIPGLGPDPAPPGSGPPRTLPVTLPQPASGRHMATPPPGANPPVVDPAIQQPPSMATPTPCPSAHPSGVDPVIQPPPITATPPPGGNPPAFDSVTQKPSSTATPSEGGNPPGVDSVTQKPPSTATHSLVTQQSPSEDPIYATPAESRITPAPGRGSRSVRTRARILAAGKAGGGKAGSAGKAGPEHISAESKAPTPGAGGKNVVASEISRLAQESVKPEVEQDLATGTAQPGQTHPAVAV